MVFVNLMYPLVAKYVVNPQNLTRARGTLRPSADRRGGFAINLRKQYWGKEPSVGEAILDCFRHVGFS